MGTCVLILPLHTLWRCWPWANVLGHFGLSDKRWLRTKAIGVALDVWAWLIVWVANIHAPQHSKFKLLFLGGWVRHGYPRDCAAITKVKPWVRELASTKAILSIALGLVLVKFERVACSHASSVPRQSLTRRECFVRQCKKCVRTWCVAYTKCVLHGVT